MRGLKNEKDKFDEEHVASLYRNYDDKGNQFIDDSAF